MSTKLANPFLWTMNGGGKIPVTAMQTSHLFYAVRMIFNHTVPEMYKIHGCVEWNRASRTFKDKRYAREAVEAMLIQLATRPDIPDDFLEQLEYMRQISQQVLQLKLS